MSLLDIQDSCCRRTQVIAQSWLTYAERSPPPLTTSRVSTSSDLTLSSFRGRMGEGSALPVIPAKAGIHWASRFTVSFVVSSDWRSRVSMKSDLSKDAHKSCY